MKRVKHVTMTWAHEKKIKDDQELVRVEGLLENLYEQDLAGFP
jgi:hypothetical protein